jgi:peptidoglycan/xylan/chitin deacetylase (PgdA/CDA1 family)
MNLLHLDRWATLWLAAPLKRAIPDRLPRISVLMYHSVSPAASTSRVPYYDTVTDPETFRAQMRFLRNNGYEVTDLEAAGERLCSGKLTGNKTVVITFDDGFRDFYQYAYPALAENGFTATMFLPTGFIGETRRRFKNTECMIWSEVTEMASHGISFGGHSVTHRKLAALPQQELQQELRDCKVQIEQRLQKTVSTFACPFAFPQANTEFKRRYRDILNEVNYKVAVTTCIGRGTVGDDLLTLKRLPINRFDDSKLLEAKLSGSYDWLARVQALIQSVKTTKRNDKQKGAKTLTAVPASTR